MELMASISSIKSAESKVSAVVMASMCVWVGVFTPANAVERLQVFKRLGPERTYSR